MLDLESGKIKDFMKFDLGNVCMATGGHNNGRVGTIVHKEKHKGSFDIIHIEDAAGSRFATRSTNVFVIGKGNKPMISLPKGKGIRLTILQVRTAATAVYRSCYHCVQAAFWQPCLCKEWKQPAVCSSGLFVEPPSTWHMHSASSAHFDMTMSGA